MKIQKFIYVLFLMSIISFSCNDLKAQENKFENVKQEGKRFGPSTEGGNFQRPAPSPELQDLINVTVPFFTQNTFIDEKADTLNYKLFVPKDLNEGEKYPLVLFMADLSTLGKDTDIVLTQGYGALVWAAPEFQREHPCFVLVPEYTTFTVNDKEVLSPQVDETISLLKSIADNYPIDKNRIYTTGQSMGCMMSLYFNIQYPNLFAAALYVSGQWDVERMKHFKDDKFIYITAEGDEKATGVARALEELLKKENSQYGYATWSARLPQEEQDKLAQKLLDEGYERNFILFEGNSVLPEDGRGIAHMESFNFAYKLKPVTEWLLNQTKE